MYFLPLANKVLSIEKIKPNFKGRSTAQYYVNEKQREEIKNFRLSNTSETETNGYEPKFVLSAWCSERGEMLNIDSYCKKYNLPRKDITSYKLVSHTGTPFYNIVFKENIEEQTIDFDFEPIVKKYIKPLKIKQQPLISNKDFDVLTYTDIHIGMNTNAEGKAMYSEKWDAEEVLNLAELIIITTGWSYKSFWWNKNPSDELVWFDISVKSIVLPLIITTGLYLRIGHKFKMKGS